jgi:hypothetical protein
MYKNFTMKRKVELSNPWSKKTKKSDPTAQDTSKEMAEETIAIDQTDEGDDKRGDAGDAMDSKQQGVMEEEN